MIKALAFLLTLLIAPVAWAAADQAMIGGTGVQFSGSSANTFYAGLGGGGSTSIGQNTWDLTEATKHNVIPTAGTLSDMRLVRIAAPGSGITAVYTVRKNGVDTSLTCTIADTNTSCTDSTNSATFAVGDTVSISEVLDGAAASTAIGFSFRYEATTDDEMILGSSTDGALSTSAVRYVPVRGGNGAHSGEGDPSMVVGAAGTLKKMHIVLQNAPGSGKSYAVVLRQNGSDTALTCTVSDTATTCSDTSNTVAVSAGDTISYKVTPSGTPASTAMGTGIVFVGTTDGDTIIGGMNASANFNSHELSVTGLDNSTTGNFHGSLGQATATITSMYAKVTTAPGTGNSWTFTLRQNQVDTALSCTISDTATTCNDTGSISVSNDDNFDVNVTESGTATGVGEDTVGLALNTPQPAAPSARRIISIL